MYEVKDKWEWKFDAGVLQNSISDSNSVQGGLDLTINPPPTHLQSCPVTVSGLWVESKMLVHLNQATGLVLAADSGKPHQGTLQRSKELPES